MSSIAAMRWLRPPAHNKDKQMEGLINRLCDYLDPQETRQWHWKGLLLGWGNGLYYLRLWGPGIAMTDIRRHGLDFSQREGYRKFWCIWPYVITYLRSDA
jgi:hypothetical protein